MKKLPDIKEVLLVFRRNPFTWIALHALTKAVLSTIPIPAPRNPIMTCAVTIVGSIGKKEAGAINRHPIVKVALPIVAIKEGNCSPSKN